MCVCIRSSLGLSRLRQTLPVPLLSKRAFGKSVLFEPESVDPLR